MVHLYSIAINFQIILNNCHYILLNYILELLHHCPYHDLFFLLFISFMHSVNGAQLLNITFLFLSLGAAIVHVFLTVIVLLVSMYALL